MHHLYSSAKGDTLCPLGFHPQVRWPTRCKRCFRDYKDHAGKKSGLRSTTASSPSLSPSWEPPSGKSAESSEGKRTWASTSNLTKDEPYKDYDVSEDVRVSAVWNSAMDLSSFGKESGSNEDQRAAKDTSSSSSSSSNVNSKVKLKSYAGSQSDSFNIRRHSSSEVEDRPQKLQIKGVIDKSNGTNSDNDVEFIIQVRKSSKVDNPTRNDVLDTDEKGGKTEKNEVERLRAQLNDVKARCEKVEKEKSEILLRRLSSMDSVSSKASTNEVSKLQKSVKELQSKNEALTEEKLSLSSKLKSLERELNSKSSRNEKDKQNEELRSKLKAAETLCESLMDENEDMKKEIRELEEEIYEMQDNFREEQADEYTSLRKNLEQSNKNCRILSFKLRKLERKTEELEKDKGDLEKKYNQSKKIEEILKKVGSEFKSRSQKKTTEYTTKVQLRKMVDEVEKEMGEVLAIFANLMEGKDTIDVPSQKSQENDAKFEKLSKEYEILKQKLDKSLKELANEKESKKADQSKGNEEKRNDLQQNLKKKLEESKSAREADRKTWESEKVKLNEEKEKLKSKLLSLSAEKLKVYNEVVQLKKDLEAASSSSKVELAVNELKKELAQEREKMKNLQDELTSHVERESRMTKTLASVEQTKSLLDAEIKRLQLELDEIKSSNASKIAQLNAELSEAKKEKDKMKSQLEKEKDASEIEISALKKKITSLEKAGVNTKKLNELKQSYNEKIMSKEKCQFLDLENEVKKGTREFQELTEKHGKLNENRSQLETENKLLNSKLQERQSSHENLESELKKLRETLNSKEDAWQSQKTRLEERLSEFEKSSKKFSLNEANDEINRLKKENSSLKDQLEDLRRLNDDIGSKLKDYTAITKIQRNLSADTTALESELRKAKNALVNAEKSKKADLAQCKMRYEHRITAINDEIKSIQNQLSRYKRERDTYKHMLEGAQRTIAELKVARQRRLSSTSIGKSDEDGEENVTQSVSALEKQISSMEDELSETRLEASKLKTELVSEKSAWQVKLSEMQSRINELEEERMLASGRTKIPGLKVRMELAWQKEREEQQRLLQETSTLARDLRQTLFEVERERDKERLENKRKQDQLKKIFDEEKEENKKKLIELQCDLLELRDAHAKLRTSNEKMRREKERHEREREELRDVISNKRRLEQTEARNMNLLLQQVDDLMKLFPEIGKKNPDVYTPTPPRRLKGPKSRESSPMLESKDDYKEPTSTSVGVRTEKLEYTIGKLMEVAKEMKESKRAIDDAAASRAKKFGKRSTSIDNDTDGRAKPKSKPSLKRKSISLEQTAGKADQIIWGTDSNVSSMQSLDGSEAAAAAADTRHFSLQRDSSVDSRLSGGSTKSEMLHRDKKHGKGIIRKITTKLTKSASVDDPNSSFDFSIQTSGSEASINDEAKHEKKNLKKKLTDMFKRGSKSNGLDKKSGSREVSRPSSRNSTTSKA